MISLPIIGLLAGIAISAQDAPEMPAAWKQKTEAAEKVQKSGDQVSAEALLLEVVREAEKLGPQDLRLAKPLENLGTFYVCRPAKRFTEAEPLLRRALAIREKAQGPDHPDLAVPLCWLAVCRMCANRHDAKAGPMLQRAQAILEKTKDPAKIADMLQLMAWRHMVRKEYDQAEPELMKALAIREKAFGPESAEAADLLDSLGSLHAAQAYPFQAEGQTKPDPDAPPALLSERSIFDPPGGEATVGGKTKGELEAERHGKQAEQFYKRALAIREKLLKPKDPRIAESLFRLGQLASLRDRLGDAEGYLTRWLASQQSAKAPPSRPQAEAFNTLAQAAQQQEDWAEAERRLARAQAILERLYGHSHDEVASVLVERADVAVNAGRFDDAETFLRGSLEIWTARFGLKDPDIVQVRNLMAGSYRDHVADPQAPLLWDRLRALSDEHRENREHWKLLELVSGYADLLRRSNRVFPSPTEEDLAYLRKARIVPSDEDLASIASGEHFLEPELENEDLVHVARLYELEGLTVNSGSDAGLAHIKGLLNLRDLTLTGNGITDAGLKHLEGLVSLRRLCIKGTKVTPAGLERLSRARPGLNIDHRPGPGYLPFIPPRPAPAALAPLPPPPEKP